MRVVQGADAVTAALRAAVVTVGNFDGVHRGHRVLLDRTVGEARSRGLSALAMTFDPHPAAVLAPDRRPRLIAPLDRRLDRIAQAGVDGVVVQPFDGAFSRLSAADFVDRVLGDALDARCVVVGPGFCYGAGRAGTVETLRSGTERHRVDVVEVQPVLEGGTPISSSRIRDLIARGAVEEAGRLLGYGPELVGTVVRGEGRGRELGIPTANLQPESELVPADGVYAGRVVLPEGRFRAVVNIGVRPTFEAGRSAEAHLLDFEGDLYDRRLVVSLDRRLRDERRFPTVDALLHQIADDIREART
jgi:riboflavin kinase/FMN adenylyltransferase